jgi:hypothetical protein
VNDNPAIALYDYWLMVLNGARLPRESEWLRGSLQFGRDTYMGLIPLRDGTPERPHIGYGYTFSHNTERFTLTPEGHFKMTKMHGYKVRNAIQNNTFLTWLYGWRGYHWTTAENLGGHYRRLEDWENPIHYTPEWAMNLQWYTSDPDWLRLEEVDGAWHIKPVPSGVYPECDSRIDLFERAERLRIKRYRRLELQARRRWGEIPPAAPSVDPEVRVRSTARKR